MKKAIVKTFNYVENFWIGVDGKPSLRSILAIFFSLHFIDNLNFAVKKWSQDRSFEGLSLLLGIEAGLIVSLLGLTAYSNIATKKIEVGQNTVSPIQVETVEQVNVKTE